jgi:hypothetical protein
VGLGELTVLLLVEHMAAAAAENLTVRAEQFVLFGQGLPDYSLQQTQVMCNETLH